MLPLDSVPLLLLALVSRDFVLKCLQATIVLGVLVSIEKLLETLTLVGNLVAEVNLTDIGSPFSLEF